jgi:hypothetical protein
MGLFAAVIAFLMLLYLLYAVIFHRFDNLIALLLFLLVIIALFRFSIKYLYALNFILKGKVILTDYYDPRLLETRGCSLIEKKMFFTNGRYYIVECSVDGHKVKLIVYPTVLIYRHTTSKRAVLNVILEGNEEIFERLGVD